MKDLQSFENFASLMLTHKLKTCKKGSYKFGFALNLQQNTLFYILGTVGRVRLKTAIP